MGVHRRPGWEDVHVKTLCGRTLCERTLCGGLGMPQWEDMCGKTLGRPYHVIHLCQSEAVL